MKYTDRRLRKLAGLLKEDVEMNTGSSWEDLNDILGQMEWPGIWGFVPRVFQKDLNRGKMDSGEWKLDLSEDPDYGDDYVKLSVNDDGTFDGIHEHDIGGNLGSAAKPGKRIKRRMNTDEAARFVLHAISMS
jgi:hypothetical protein